MVLINKKYLFLFVILILLVSVSGYLYIDKFRVQYTGNVVASCQVMGGQQCGKGCCNLGNDGTVCLKDKICCPQGWTYAEAAKGKPYCKPPCAAPNIPCQAECCNNNTQTCVFQTFLKIDTVGQCVNKNCANPCPTTGDIADCCNANDECKRYKIKEGEVFALPPTPPIYAYICSANSCSDPTPEKCTATNPLDGQTMSICCPTGKCRLQVTKNGNTGYPYCA